MFNSKKIQLEILKDALNGEHVRKINISDKYVGFTSGYYVYVLERNKLYLDLEKFTELEFKFSDAEKEHPQIKSTGIYKESAGKTLCKYVSESGVVSYVNKAYIAPFLGSVFYSDGGTNPIYAKDAMGNLVGFILPIRCSGGEF